MIDINLLEYPNKSSSIRANIQPTNQKPALPFYGYQFFFDCFSVNLKSTNLKKQLLTNEVVQIM
jgi:hypothetical protein